MRSILNWSQRMFDQVCDTYTLLRRNWFCRETAGTGHQHTKAPKGGLAPQHRCPHSCKAPILSKHTPPCWSLALSFFSVFHSSARAACDESPFAGPSPLCLLLALHCLCLFDRIGCRCAEEAVCCIVTVCTCLQEYCMCIGHRSSPFCLKCMPV